MKTQLILFLFVVHAIVSVAQPAYISKAISGNDHDRKKPLIEAWENGFAGISAELNLKKNGELYCGSELLQKIYLEPTQKKITQGNGNIYNGRTEEFLMIFELRSDDMETIKALEKVIEPFKEMLSSRESGEIQARAVRLIVTGKNGNTPEYISSSKYIFTEVPFNKTIPSEASVFTGTAGMRFKKVYDWNGNGSMPNMQYHSFNSMIKVAQKSGRRVRVFDIPELPNAFDLFLNAGADYLQVNDIGGFVTYWRNRKPY